MALAAYRSLLRAARIAFQGTYPPPHNKGKTEVKKNVAITNKLSMAAQTTSTFLMLHSRKLVKDLMQTVG